MPCVCVEIFTRSHFPIHSFLDAGKACKMFTGKNAFPGHFAFTKCVLKLGSQSDRHRGTAPVLHEALDENLHYGVSNCSTGHVVYRPLLQYEQRGGGKSVDRLQASSPFRLLSSSPRDNDAHAQLRTIPTTSVRH